MLSAISRSRFIVAGAIVLFWAVMAGWLIRVEAFPQWFGRPAAGYRALLDDAPAAMDSWMRILFRDRTIGYSRFRLDTQEHDPSARYLLHHEVVLRLAILGATQQVSGTAEAALDVWRQLQRFTLALRGGPYGLRAEGHRIGKTSFEVRLDSSAGPSQLNLEIPDDVILYSPMQEFQLKRLQPGEHLRLRTLDPFSFKPSEILVEAGLWEPVAVSGRTTNALALQVTSGRVALRAWMDAEGRVLREESPLGWVLEACTPEQALAWNASPGATSQDEQLKEWGGLFERLKTGMLSRED
jgi:hypothetical protein